MLLFDQIPSYKLSTHCIFLTKSTMFGPILHIKKLRLQMIINLWKIQQSTAKSGTETWSLFCQKGAFLAITLALPKLFFFLIWNIIHIPSCCCLFAKLCQTLLWPHGLSPIKLLCSWDSPHKNTGVGFHLLLQVIFLTQRSNQFLLH